MIKTLRTLFVSFTLLIATNLAQSQNVVVDLNFDGYMGTAATVPAGFYFSWNNNTSNSFYTSTGNYGVAPPSYKFGNDGDFIVTPMVSAADSLSFWSKGNGSPFSPLNELRIYHSMDSVNWILDNTLVPLSASANMTSVPLNQLTGYFKFEYYKAPAGGNLAFDDLKIYSSQTVGVKDLVRDEIISVFPTPTSGLLNIRIQNSGVVVPDVEVYDMLGNKISSIYVEKKGRGLFAIDLSGKNNGFYFVKIRTSKQFVTRRITLSN
jgi:hypothetical protein